MGKVIQLSGNTTQGELVQLFGSDRKVIRARPTLGEEKFFRNAFRTGIPVIDRGDGDDWGTSDEQSCPTCGRMDLDCQCEFPEPPEAA